MVYSYHAIVQLSLTSAFDKVLSVHVTDMVHETSVVVENCGARLVAGMTAS